MMNFFYFFFRAKALVFLVLSSLLVSVNSNAQLVTIPSANTNTGSVRSPLGTYYGYQRSAMIYTAAEAGASGMITSVAFYVNAISTPGVMTDTRVYIKQTAASSFTAVSTYANEISGATLVYGNSTIPTSTLVANTWITIPLTTPFCYSNSSNIEVILETNATGTGNEGTAAKSFRYSTLTNGVQYWDQDNTPLSTTGTRAATRPNIQINKTTIPVVPTVSNSGPICSGTTATLTATGMSPGGQTAAFTGAQAAASSSITSISNTFTMEFWVNPTSTRTITTQLNGATDINGTTGQRYAIYPCNSGTNSGAGVSVGINGVAVFEHGNSYLPSLLVYDVPISGWTHVAVVYTAKVPSLYLNGTLVKTGLTSGKTNVYPSIGSGESGGYGAFIGGLENVRIWNGALTATEINAIRFLRTATTSKTVLAQYKFDGGIYTDGVGANAAWNSPATNPNASYLRYTWTGTGAPAFATTETQTTAALSTNPSNFTVAASIDGICPSTASATNAVVVNSSPVLDGTTVSSTCWINDNAHDYTITVKATGTSPSDIGGNTNGMMALVNYQGAHAGSYGGYYAWNTTQALLTAAGYGQNQMACTGGGWVGMYNGVSGGGYGNTTASLQSASTSVTGNQRTVNFVVRPGATFPKFTDNSISQYAQLSSGCAAGWTETTNLFTSTPNFVMGTLTVNSDAVSNTVQACLGATIDVSQSGFNNQGGTTYFYCGPTAGYGSWVNNISGVDQWTIIANGTVTAANQVGYSSVNNLTNFNYKINSTGNYILHANTNYGSCYGGGYNRYININSLPANPGNPTSNSPQCASPGVTLTRTGTVPAGETWYWQTSASGTSTASSGSTYNVTTSNTYYIRSQNNTTGCWSAGAGSLAVVITATPTAAGTPSPANAATAVCYKGTGAVTTISWATVAGATGYDVYFGTTASPSIVSTNQAGLSYSTGTLLPNQTYYWKVAPRNACGANVPGTNWTFTTAMTPCGYCAANGTTTTAGAITYVGFNTIANNTVLSCSASTKGTGYSDFTSQTTTVIPSSVYNLTTRVNTDYNDGSYEYYVKVWIDWNQDGVFSTSTNEQYDLSYAYNKCDGATASSPLAVTVPSGAISGNTRMRVMVKYYAAPTDPCATGLDGEVEDYTIIVYTPLYRAEYVSASFGSSNWCAGETRTVTVQVKNTGTQTWYPTGTRMVNLAYKWNADPWFDSYTPGRFSLGASVAPNATGTATISITAPTTIGSNNLSFNIVKENGPSGTDCWFPTNAGECGPGNAIYTTGAIAIQPKPTVDAGTDQAYCGRNVLSANTNLEMVLLDETFETATSPTEITPNSTGSWKIKVYSAHDASWSGSSNDRSKWYIRNSSSGYTCVDQVGAGNALVMYDNIVGSPCDWFWGISSNGNIDQIAYATQNIDARFYTNLKLRFKYQVTGGYDASTAWDYMQIVYSTDGGTSWTILNSGNGNAAGRTFDGAGGVNNGYVGTSGGSGIVQANTLVSLPSSLNGVPNLLVGFRWRGNNDQIGYIGGPAIDDVYVTGVPTSTVWSGPGFVSGNTTNTPIVNVAGTYTLTLTAGNGCSASDDVVVTTPALVINSTPKTDPTTCGGMGSIVINGSSTNSAVCDWFMNDLSSATGLTLFGTPTPVAEDGRLILSRAYGSKNGGIVIPNPNTYNASSFKMEFDSYIGAGNSADGFSISYAGDIGSPTSGSVAGLGSGLSISFDTYNNGASGYQSGGSNQAGIYLVYGGVVQSFVAGTTWRNTKKHITVFVNTSNQLTLKVGTTTIFSNVAFPAGYGTANKSTWKFALSCQTGGLLDEHAIQNLAIVAYNQFEYSIDGSSWQASNSFTPLAGTYTPQMRGKCATSCAVTASNVTLTDPNIAANAFLATTPNSGVTLVVVCEEAGWTYYSDPADSSKWLFGINKNGNLFNANVKITLKSTAPTAYDLKQDLTNKKALYTMGRYWDATLSSGLIDPGSPVSVRFFYDPADTVAMTTAAAAWITARGSITPPYPSNYVLKRYPIEWFKTVGIPYNPANNRTGSVPTAIKPPFSYGTKNNVNYVELRNVSSFSGGTAALRIDPVPTANSPLALPVELIYLTATPVENQYIRLDWATATEINNRGFDVERSDDGENFTKIAWVDGYGNSSQKITYKLDDRDVVPNRVYYYRLKQIDNDAKYEYTYIVSAKLIADKGFVFEELRPNPASNKVVLNILTSISQEVKVNVFDVLGQVVLTQNWQLFEGLNGTELDLQNLSGGTYTVTVISEGVYTSKKLVIAR